MSDHRRRYRVRPQSLKPGNVFRISYVSLALVAGAAFAEADGPDYYRVTGVASNDVLNLRAAPNAKAAKVGAIPPNSNCVRNLGCQGGLSFREFSELSPARQQERLRQHPRWCHVEYRGVTGWVAGRFLAEGSCP